MAGTSETSKLADKAGPRSPAGTAPIKVAIVEDDDWIRENLASQIDLAPGYCCVSRYRTGEEALAGLPSEAPDVVLMDINLPGLSGIECVRRLKALRPSLTILMLTVYEESDQIFDSLRAGASGYLLKRSAEKELLEAIAQVHQGGSPMSSLVARKVVQFFNRLGDAATGTPALVSARKGDSRTAEPWRGLQGNRRPSRFEHPHRAHAYSGHLRQTAGPFPRRGGVQVLAIIMNSAARIILTGTLACAGAAAAMAGTNYYSLAVSAPPTNNPLKGFMPYQGDYATFPYSIEWNYLPLRSLMTAPTNFNWTNLEALISDVASRGHQTVFRVYLDYPTLPTGIPQYLLDAGLATVQLHRLRQYNKRVPGLPEPAPGPSPDQFHRRAGGAL